MDAKECSLGYRFSILALFAVAYGLLYVIPNFFFQSTPSELPMLWIDRVIPLIPWTFIIYTSDYFIFIIAIFMFTERHHFNSFARMMFAVLTVCGLFFYSYPTVYPRPPYEPQSHWLIGSLMDFIAMADSPRNCFPSMHVGLTSVATWAMRPKGRKMVFLFSGWSLAIFISTLTTKQHYFYDILGGLVVMAVVVMLESLLFVRAKSSLITPSRLP
ncbi:MAG: hypothetical protein EB078_06680 [Proteobacteria bacterium]|nr:hypothetical protein [Pseudomonadota bacterium]NDC24714.1 hypothetical protein [Pseudomonadota bacterium]NDD04573.1 hypothetical protein [Pseudomonadota bacterium]NDG27012.1 hypothetical protein [Pseudomonadota bacterium]